MINHSYKLTALAAGLALITMQSCKKDDSAAPRAEKLIGTWIPYQTGIDSNQNGTWDENERQAVASNAGGQVTFEAGGVGRFKGDTSLAGRPITWTLQDNEVDLRVIILFENTSDTIPSKIVYLNATELVTRNDQNGRDVYSLMRKR